jgi:hypothetical protein
MAKGKKGESIPTRFNPEEEKCLDEIVEQTGVSRSMAIRQAVKYALPKFLSGEVDILKLVPGARAS